MPKQAYEKPTKVERPAKRESFSTGGSTKMLYGNSPTSLPECDNRLKKDNRRLLKG